MSSRFLWSGGTQARYLARKTVCLPKQEGARFLELEITSQAAAFSREIQFISCSVGNGHSAKFWFDSWTPFGEQGWKLAAPRSGEALALHVHLTTVQLPGTSKREDSYTWVADGSDYKEFSHLKYNVQGDQTKGKLKRVA
ncbi:unnamed protein product [Microthlaspi erraticum]|uniref:Uncharacterized protein n=1 Tax=Microthlaspi erraticum TaxID=1685480 RepID=A0A6D2KTI3_9BRAS|nr:unnamed protein product [Microthlaspi erraticum]